MEEEEEMWQSLRIKNYALLRKRNSQETKISQLIKEAEKRLDLRVHQVCNLVTAHSQEEVGAFYLSLIQSRPSF